MEEGDFVLDKANGDKLILFSKLGTPCDEWVVRERDVSSNRYEEQTVWDYNSRYEYCNPEDPVCKCVYLASCPFEPLRFTNDERATRLQKMNTDEIEYCFPITRLREY